MARNLALSARATGTNLTYFSLDAAGIEQVWPCCDVVDISEQHLNVLDCCMGITEAPASFGSLEFASLAWQRYGIIKALLKSGRNAIYLDTDIVINMNYEREINELLENSGCDFLVQANHLNLPCTGFLAVSAKAADLFGLIYSSANIAAYGYGRGIRVLGGASDQSFFGKPSIQAAKSAHPRCQQDYCLEIITLTDNGTTAIMRQSRVWQELSTSTASLANKQRLKR